MIAFLLHAAVVGSTLFSVSNRHQDEGYYVASTRSMVDGGDWLVPEFAGKPRVNKPILFYWLTAIPQLVFGPGLAAARLASLASSLVLLAVAWKLTALFLPDERRRVLAIWMLVSADCFTRYAHYAVPEMTLTLTMTAAHWMIVAGDRARREGAPCRVFVYLLYALMGLGFCIKGPVAIILPLLTAVTYYAVNGRLRDAVWLVSPVGLIIMLLIAAPWYLYLLRRIGWDDFSAMLRRETLSRVTGWDGGWFFYVGVWLGYHLPWTVFLLAARGARASGGGGRAAVLGFLQSYPVVWIVTSLLFYSLFVGERHAWYGVQTCVPTLIILAMIPLDPARRPVVLRLLRFFRWLAVLTPVVLLGAFVVLGNAFLSTTALLIMMIAGALGAGVLWRAEGRAVSVLARCVILAVVVMMLRLTVSFTVHETTPLRPVSRFARHLQAHDTEYRLLTYSWYYERKVQLYEIPQLRKISGREGEEAFREVWSDKRPEFLICPESWYEAAPETLRGQYITVETGFHKKRELDIRDWLQTIWARDADHVFDRVLLLQRRAISAPTEGGRRETSENTRNAAGYTVAALSNLDGGATPVAGLIGELLARVE